MPKPPEVAQIHREICERENCKYLDKIDYDNPCSFCPNGHFGRYEMIGCKDQNQLPVIKQPLILNLANLLPQSVSCCGQQKEQLQDANQRT